MHLTHAPLPTIHCSVCVPVNSVTAHHIAGPASFINLAIRIGELSIPTRLIAQPHALITCTIGPLHSALSVAHASEPLACVARIRALVDMHLDVVALYILPQLADLHLMVTPKRLSTLLCCEILPRVNLVLLLLALEVGPILHQSDELSAVCLYAD